MAGTAQRFRSRSNTQLVVSLVLVAAIASLYFVAQETLLLFPLGGGLLGLAAYFFVGPRLAGSVLSLAGRSSDLGSSAAQVGRLRNGTFVLRAATAGKHPLMLPIVRNGKPLHREADYLALMTALRTNPSNSTVADCIDAVLSASSADRQGLINQLPQIAPASPVA